MDNGKFETSKGKGRRYPKPVYFSDEENQLIKIAALINDVSINTYIHDCVMSEIEKRKDEYESVRRRIKTKENME